MSQGGTDLPPEVAELTFKGRNCYALIYSFERKRDGTATEIDQPELSAKTHLTKAGILGALTISRRLRREEVTPTHIKLSRGEWCEATLAEKPPTI